VKLYELHYKQRLPLSPGEAWDFFSNPHNLPLLTPPSLDFRITSDTPETTYAGMIITYRIRPVLNLPLSWVTEITHADPPHFFVDEQRFGPYAFWHHRHRFTPAEGGVEIDDHVHYGLPFGWAGRAANRLTVGRRLEEIFRFRREYLERRFGKTGAGAGTGRAEGA
jgi:ligand-binding SRPBCC domain-containing protein